MLQVLNASLTQTPRYPERILQFGEGNFLRAFVDWMVHTMNRQGLFHGRVVVVQPIAQGMVEALNAQDGRYTLLLRGLEDGKVAERREIITSISRGIDPYDDWQGFLACAHNPDLRFVVSNTTEAGIAYIAEPQPIDACPQSFPAKVTAFLYERYRHFDGAPARGMVFLPCELIDRNGETLRDCVLRCAAAWGLDDAFVRWVEEENPFLNTLVDRIVTGYPREEAERLCAELGYEDRLLDTGEIFHLWVIEGDATYQDELPLAQAGLHVIWTDDLQPYRTRKVRILNGAHTMTVLAAHLCGLATVRACVEDPLISAYMRRGVYEEIVPTLDLPAADTRAFADAVFARFANPFIHHRVLDIALNSVAKFAVRVLPSLLEYHRRTGTLPPVLTVSLAALLVFYRGGEGYQVRDEAPVLDAIGQAWRQYEEGHLDAQALCHCLLARADWWGQDLTHVSELVEAVADHVRSILHHGMRPTLTRLIGQEVADGV